MQTQTPQQAVQNFRTVTSLFDKWDKNDKRGAAPGATRFPQDLAHQVYYFWKRGLMVAPRKASWAVYRALHPNHARWAVKGGQLV